MLSVVPLLSYSDPSPVSDGDRSLSTIGALELEEGGENSPSSSGVRQMSRSNKTSELPREGRRAAKTGASTGTGTGKKKRRPTGAGRKVSSSTKKSSESNGSRNGGAATSDEKKRVEELVSKVTAHAKAIQAVKKAVFQIQLVLLEGVKEPSQLQHARPLLTQDEYSDVVTERSITQLCGYPLCEKKLLPEKARKGRYRISLREHKVYDLSETGLFCSTDCLIASKTFQSSLEVQRDDIMGKKKLMSIVQSVCDPGSASLNNNIHHHHDHRHRHHPQQQDQDQDHMGVMSGGKDQQQKDDRAILSNGSSLMSGIHERVDVFGTSSFGDDDGGNGPFDAIEGYVPKNSQRSQQTTMVDQLALPLTQEGVQAKGGRRDLETCSSGNQEEQGEENPQKQLLQLDKNGKTLAAVLSDSHIKPDDEVQGESSSTIPALKSALRKKGKSESKMKRNVSWEDRKKKEYQTAEKKEEDQQHPSVKSNARPTTHPSPPTAAAESSAPISDNMNPQDLSANGSGSSIDEIPMPKSSCKDSLDPAEEERNVEDVSTSVRTEDTEGVLASEEEEPAAAEAMDGGGNADAFQEIDGSERVLATVEGVEAVETAAEAVGGLDNLNVSVETEKKSERILATVEAAAAAPAPADGRNRDSGSGSGEEVPVEMEKSERVVAAEEVATALAEAAEAAACGRIGSAEAVERVGLSIIPENDRNVKEMIPDAQTQALGQIEDDGSFKDFKKESPSSVNGSVSTVSAEVDVRWPQLESKEEEEEEDDDELGAIATKGAWHDTPPRRFKVEVSMFGTIWMALDEWISAATVAHVYGKDPHLCEDEFLVANGREYRRRRLVPSEDGGLGSTSAAISKAFSACLSQAFPDVVRGLRLSVPLSTMEQNLGRLVRTMTFIEALPALDGKEWSLILTLMLDALSVQRLPSLGLHLAKNLPLRRKFLDSIGANEAEYEIFRAVLLPLGSTSDSLN